MMGETLYPPNSCPEAMQAVDAMLELSDDLMNAYTPFYAPIMPKYAEREECF